MALPSIPKLSAHGAEIPAVGFGTSSLGNCGEIVATALTFGYRHIDTAWKYGTERGVGEGMRASGVPRSDIFLTTKVSHEYLRTDDFARAVDESLKNLGVDYVDLLLVHWPNPDIPLAEPIAALAKAKRQGQVEPPASRVRHPLQPQRLGNCWAVFFAINREAVTYQDLIGMTVAEGGLSIFDEVFRECDLSFAALAFASACADSTRGPTTFRTRRTRIRMLFCDADQRARGRRRKKGALRPAVSRDELIDKGAFITGE
jgi:hypothetical protein